MRFRTLYLVLCGLLLGHAATAAEPPTAPTPPTQPAEGPGGAAYRHASVHQWHFGEGAREYWVFTPEQPVPGNAPLVIFLHGWSVMQPDLYRAWIDHIVRRGMVVVYPRYQPDLKTPNADFLDNAAGALGDALRRLQAGELGVRPRLNQVAYLGHSAGGLLAANLAAASERLKLPAAKALMVVEPGKSQGKRWDGVAQERLSGLAKGTLLLAVCGDEDSHVACTDAKRIYRQSRTFRPATRTCCCCAAIATALRRCWPTTRHPPRRYAARSIRRKKTATGCSTASRSASKSSRPKAAIPATTRW